MGFLLPVAFGLLGLLSILIVFYLFKKKFERKVISSTYLWEQIMKEWETNRWNKKLNQNLLLFLQILIMVAIILALTRPFINSEDIISSEQVVIVLDTSASMAVMEEEVTRLELAKEQIKQLVQQLNKNQTVTIVNAKSKPELLLTNESNQHQIITSIDDIQLSYEVDNLVDSMKLANSLIHQQSAEIHLYSDQVEKKDLETLPIKHNLVVHNIGESKQNFSIRSFGVKLSGNLVKGVVTIFNEGDKEKSVTVQIKSEDKLLQEVKETLPPNKLKVIEVNDLTFETVYEVRINEKDAYLFDNNSYAFLVNDETPTIYAAGEVNPFIIKAVQSLGSEVVTVKGDDFPKDVSAGISILSNVPATDWPNGAKLVISPTVGGPFKIQDKKELKYVLSRKDDPMLSYVDTDNLYLAKSYPIDALNGLQPLITSGDEVVVAKGKYKKNPIVLFSFDVEDSDWPLHPSFPVLLNNVLNYLKPANAYLGRFLPGETIDITYSPTTTSAYIDVSDGSKVNNVNTKIPLQVPLQPGLYELHEKTETGLKSRYFSVEVADREKTAFSSESFSITVKDQQIESNTAGSIEIWYWVAFFALFILFIEWEVYRRGISGR